MTRVGAIDIGTNTTLLLVAEGDGARLERVAERSRITRLGQGVDRTGRLDPAAIARTLDALREHVAAARALGAAAVGAVGTSALRDAENRDAFLAPAAAILGRPLEVVSGRREALLELRGVESFFAPLPDPTVVFDVGGGSTEVILARGGSLAAAESLDVGTVRLLERLVAGDPPSARELGAVRRAVDAALDRLPPPFAAARPPARLIGVAGTLTTLAAVSLALEPYDAARVNGHRLSRAEVAALLDRLAALPLAARQALPGLEPARADVIVPGAVIVLAVMDRLGAGEVTVSDRGTRWGLALELAASVSKRPG